MYKLYLLKLFSHNNNRSDITFYLKRRKRIKVNYRKKIDLSPYNYVMEFGFKNSDFQGFIVRS